MENDVLSSLWETLLNGDQSIPKMSGCKKWLSQAVPRSLTEDTLLLDVMNDFTKEWIINNYKEPIEAFLKSQFNRPMTLDVEIRPDLANKEEDLFPGHGAAAPKAKEPLIPKRDRVRIFLPTCLLNTSLKTSSSAIPIALPMPLQKPLPKRRPRSITRFFFTAIQDLARRTS